MSRFKAVVCLPCVLVIVIITLLLVGISFVPIAHAQARQRTLPATDTSNCAVTHTRTFDIFCVAPGITTSCPGQQFFPATDGFGKAIDWTFTDVGNTCVHVSYSITHSNFGCDVDMYIPDGDATATFTYTWFDGQTHTGTFNENPVSGWRPLFTSPDPVSMSFTDHDSPGALQLGWGSNSSDGLRVTCS
jgi:hypothetical protein